ncbi:MAG: hypothetical protein IJZ66_03035, partial [Oscillibacter sp.]|nr:hypothetical protein [Oscillibacter sp.]
IQTVAGLADELGHSPPPSPLFQNSGDFQDFSGTFPHSSPPVILSINKAFPKCKHFFRTRIIPFHPFLTNFMMKLAYFGMVSAGQHKNKNTLQRNI